VSRAIVTGGAGFIGSHLVDALLARGDEVTVLDHLSRGHCVNLKAALAGGATLREAEVTDVAQMIAALGSFRPDVVYHLAAQIDVRRSVSDPSTDAHVNVGGTAAVLEAARETGTRRVILASTAGVYGEPTEVPTPEHTPIAPLSPYGASKAAAETYMQLFLRLHGLSTLALRMANVYGPRQDPKGEAGVVAIFTGAAREGRTATIYGDGAQTRDYVYVSDVVAAWAAAGPAEVTGVLNVSTGRETSVAELARHLGLTTDPKPGRAGEISRSCLDPTAALKSLGWRARVSLAEGLERIR
jgi:UDP-glucose 4-epimerase